MSIAGSAFGLDALPVNVFVERIREEVEERMDMAALEQVTAQETSERERLVEVLSSLS